MGKLFKKIREGRDKVEAWREEQLKRQLAREQRAAIKRTVQRVKERKREALHKQIDQARGVGQRPPPKQSAYQREEYFGDSPSIRAGPPKRRAAPKKKSGVQYVYIKEAPAPKRKAKPRRREPDMWGF